jgi:hypothetical protein
MRPVYVVIKRNQQWFLLWGRAFVITFTVQFKEKGSKRYIKHCYKVTSFYVRPFLVSWDVFYNSNYSTRHKSNYSHISELNYCCGATKTLCYWPDYILHVISYRPTWRKIPASFQTVTNTHVVGQPTEVREERWMDSIEGVLLPHEPFPSTLPSYYDVARVRRYSASSITGPLVTTAWHILGLRIEETGFVYRKAAANVMN